MEIGHELGQTTGKLTTFIEEQRIHNRDVMAMLTSMDARLRHVETKAAVSSLIVSGIVSVGTAILSKVFLRTV